MEPAFVTVLVEEHEVLPQGCVMRFKRVGEPRAVARVMYERASGWPSAICRSLASGHAATSAAKSHSRTSYRSLRWVC